MKVIFVGDKYYIESKTIMSSVYRQNGNSLIKIDWGEIEQALEKGESVYIRPATEEELRWADSVLLEILLKDKEKKENNKTGVI